MLLFSPVSAFLRKPGLTVEYISVVKDDNQKCRLFLLLLIDKMFVKNLFAVHFYLKEKKRLKTLFFKLFLHQKVFNSSLVGDGIIYKRSAQVAKQLLATWALHDLGDCDPTKTCYYGMLQHSVIKQ